MEVLAIPHLASGNSRKLHGPGTGGDGFVASLSFSPSHQNLYPVPHFATLLRETEGYGRPVPELPLVKTAYITERWELT